MNQDKVKEILLTIENAPLEFSLVFSGKKSRKVNGLYKPESREIIIHNRNFEKGVLGDNLLLHTALHEYAHHLHACAEEGKLPKRAHTSQFWALFHALLEKAEQKGIYRDVFAGNAELNSITETIREKYLAQNGALVKEMGKYLLKASVLCEELGARFDDYIDRVLCIPRTAAAMAVKMFNYDLNSDLGADNMRYLAGIKNNDARENAQEQLSSGKSPDTVKNSVKNNFSKSKPDDDDLRLTQLEKEKARLERTIETLSKRLDEVQKELAVHFEQNAL